MNNSNLFHKYLEILEVEAAVPTYEFLCKLVKAHLTKIPFENISKLLFKKQGMNYIPSFETYLAGIEEHNFGGTCYTNNYYFHLLLKHLGFNIILCGADMKNPDVHLINIIKIDAKEFIVDGGYAAPFLIPLPRDIDTNFIISHGNDKYIVKPKDNNNRTRVEQYSDSELQHWYTTNPRPRKIDEFRKVIENSYSDDATFINIIRAVRFTDNGSVSLRNFTLKETNGTKVIKTQISREEIPALVNKKFGVPENLVREAVNSIKEIKDVFD